MFAAYITCPIDVDFKSAIFSALGSFTKSPEIADILLQFFTEHNVLSIVAAEHKFDEKGEENKRCPLIKAICGFSTTIMMSNKFRATIALEQQIYD